MPKVKLFGYSEDISVRPGETVRFMLSAEGTTTVRTSLVRLLHGDENPQGPGYLDENVPCGADGEHPVRRQYTQQGTFALAQDAEELLHPTEAFTAYGFVHPTMPQHGRQTIMSRWSAHENRGWGLGLNRDGHLEFWAGDGKLSDRAITEVPLLERTWYFVSASFDPRSRQVRLRQDPIIGFANGLQGPVVPQDSRSRIVEKVRYAAAPSSRPFVLGGSWDANTARGDFVDWLFNGKIDRPGLHRGVLSDAELDGIRDSGAPPATDRIAFWDTTAGYTDAGIDDRIRDRGPHGLDLHGVNKPVRAMTGYNWDGRAQSFRTHPDQYGGIAFHEDAITDCRWEPTIELTVPENARSGVYALRVESSGVVDHVPFFVRPHRATARIAVQMATATYLAYANEHIAFDAPVGQQLVAHTPTMTDADIEMYKNKQFGVSTYDMHADGISGVCYSGWRRPIFGLRPTYRSMTLGTVWALPADLSIIGWLEAKGFEYDVITDHDVHREGVELMSQYNMVILCSHPEYYSDEMLDATEEFVGSGGRLSYTGANGLYWVTSFPDDGAVIEVRKLDSGIRAWQAFPGEHYHATTGQRGGIWRNRGRGPHKTTGVGFAAEGFDKSSYYRRMPDSYRDDVAWIFEGVPEEVFGRDGLALGGAAGLELDRYDLRLGTPPQTLLLASSEDHSTAYPTVPDEILTLVAGRQGEADHEVRGDVTYLPTANGGAVFCTGSIAWASALPANNYDNDVSRLFENVVRRMSADEPLPHVARTPAELADVTDQQAVYIERWRVRVSKGLISDIDDALVAEHARDPFDLRADPLLRFANYHRTIPRPDNLAIVEVTPGSDYAIVDGDEAWPEQFSDIAAATHAVFLERLARMRKVAANA